MMLTDIVIINDVYDDYIYMMIIYIDDDHDGVYDGDDIDNDDNDD